MRVLLLSRYGRLGASSRIRAMQYLPYLGKNGINIDVQPLFSDQYITALYSGNARWMRIMAGYWHRLKVFINIRKYDLIWLEKEAFPFLPAVPEYLFHLLGVPYVVDYDDAVFHQYDRHRWWPVRALLAHKIDTVMRYAAIVIAGNEYLAERARSAGAKQVEIIPTVVDIERYSVQNELSNHIPIVGWIGSPATSRYLFALKPVFKSIKEQFDVRFVAVGAKQEDFAGVPIEVWPWTEETEVQSIQEFDIGIMPLSDTPWEQGKCGYKLIQYMACGIPVVASPVGVNKKIVKDSGNGFLAEGVDQWKEALGKLLENHKMGERMGQQGRLQTEKWYSMQVQAPRLLSLLKSAANKGITS